MIKLLLLVLYSGCSVYMGYMTLYTSLSGIMGSRVLTPLYNSSIFVIYAISYISLANATASVCIPRFGRINTFTCGAVMVYSALFIFAFSTFISINQVFIFITLLTRFIQGCGASIILVSGFSILTAAYSDKIGLVTALHEICIRLGLFLGPLLGNFLLQQFGSMGQYIFLATLSVPPILASCVLQANEIPQLSHNLRAKDKINHCNRRAVFSYLTFFLSVIKLTVLITTFSENLIADFSPSSDQMALYLLVYIGSSTLISLIMPLVPEEIDKRFFMIPANLLCGVSMLFIALAPTFNHQNQSTSMLKGLILGGSFGAIVPCFVVTEAITATKQYTSSHQYEIMANQVLGYRTFTNGLGIIVGSILARFMMTQVGFTLLLQIIAGLMIAIGILDICFIIIEHRRRGDHHRRPNLYLQGNEEVAPMIDGNNGMRRNSGVMEEDKNQIV